MRADALAMYRRVAVPKVVPLDGSRGHTELGALLPWRENFIRGTRIVAAPASAAVDASEFFSADFAWFKTWKVHGQTGGGVRVWRRSIERNDFFFR